MEGSVVWLTTMKTFLVIPGIFALSIVGGNVWWVRSQGLPDFLFIKPVWVIAESYPMSTAEDSGFLARWRVDSTFAAAPKLPVFILEAVNLWLKCGRHERE